MEFSVLSICNKFESRLLVQTRLSSTLFWPTKRSMGLVHQGQICYLYFLWVQIAQQHKYIRAQCNSFKSLTHRWMHFMKPKLNGCQHGMKFMRIHIFSFLIEVENLCMCWWVYFAWKLWTLSQFRVFQTMQKYKDQQELGAHPVTIPIWKRFDLQVKHLLCHHRQQQYKVFLAPRRIIMSS